jgi:hypothetical protein
MMQWSSEVQRLQYSHSKIGAFSGCKLTLICSFVGEVQGGKVLDIGMILARREILNEQIIMHLLHRDDPFLHRFNPDQMSIICQHVLCYAFEKPNRPKKYSGVDGF